MNLVELLSIAHLLVLSLRDGLCRWHPLLESGGECGMVTRDLFEDAQTSAGHAVEPYSFSGRECREELEHLLPGRRQQIRRRSESPASGHCHRSQYQRV